MSDLLISELWNELKPLIPAKERLHVADRIVALFDEYGASDGIETEKSLDSTLLAAVKSYYEIEDEEEEYDD